MISQDIIDKAIQRLVKAYQPLEIYMYGAYAWGTPGEEDTVNLLIVVESSNQKIQQRSYKGYEMLLDIEMPKSISVFTKQEFDSFVHDKSSATHEIKTKGKLLYAPAYAQVASDYAKASTDRSADKQDLKIGY